MKKLQHTPGPWEITSIDDSKLIASAPELFESLLELLLDAMDEYEESLGNFRGGPRVRYAREIEVIEKATGCTWNELMEKEK